MNEAAVVICAIFTAILILLAIIAKLAIFCRAFASETRHICREMDYADSDEEYRRWRGELRCHYLMLIPFVNEKNVMRLYDRIFHRSDSTDTKKRKDSLVPLLLPSGVGICLCLVCLCSMTWAWFTASVETSPQTITSACYAVTVDRVETDGREVNPIDPVAGDSYDLEKDIAYTITLKATGTVKNCGGYCLIECEDVKYYTQSIDPDHEIVITLMPKISGVHTFTGVWGSISSADVENGIEIIKANDENANESITSEIVNAAPEIPKPPADEPAVENPVIPNPEPIVPQETQPVETSPIPQETKPAETDPVQTEPHAPLDTSEPEVVSDEETDREE